MQYQNSRSRYTSNTKRIDLLLEFQDKVAKYDVYIQNLIDTRPIINGSVISSYKTYTRITLLINYIKVQGYKLYTYINLKTILAG